MKADLQEVMNMLRKLQGAIDFGNAPMAEREERASEVTFASVNSSEGHSNASTTFFAGTPSIFRASSDRTSGMTQQAEPTGAGPFY